MAKMKTFKVFEDEAIGRIFMPDGFSYVEKNAVHISPFHGRAIAIKKADYEWISVKGGGWNYGGPQVYISKKDEELVFGLYGAVSAERELQVSKAIEKISDDFPKVLYYKKFSNYDLPPKYNFLSDVKYKNGEFVEPCLLYTQVKSPCKVADLMYFTEEEKLSVIKSYCSYWGVSTEEYFDKFTEKLASNVAIMHKYGFINDTLDYGNVTLLAEIVDYEWVTAPGIKFLDGTYGLELIDARREKEILYGAEVCLQLRALLHIEHNLFDIYEQFIDSYKRINPQFVKDNISINKMLKREDFIL